jgi:hypothetical protein
MHATQNVAFSSEWGRVLRGSTRAFDCRRCNGAVPGHYLKAVEQGLQADGEDRGVLTFRRIAHHYDGSSGLTRCPSLPAAAPSPCMPGASSTQYVAAVPGTPAAVDDLEAVFGRVNADVAAWPPLGGSGPDLQRAPSGPDLQRAPSHPLPEILNVMIGADLFTRYLGALEADLERIYSTTLLKHWLSS